MWKSSGQWLKSVCILSYSGPYFPAFGLNTGRYGGVNTEALIKDSAVKHMTNSDLMCFCK